MEIVIELAVGIAVAVATAFLGLVVWRLKREVERREARDQEKERKHETIAILTIEGVQSAIALGEANTLALKRGDCNGDCEAAMEYARDVKHKIKDFLTEQGIKNID